MTRQQRKALKTRVRSNLKFQKKELKRLTAIGSRLRLRQDRVFKNALSTVKKDIRLFQRLNKKIHA